MPPVFNREKCTGCGYCDSICPADAIYMRDAGEKEEPFLKYPEECWHCNACVFVCPVEGAVELRIPLPMMLLYRDRTG